MLEFEYPMEANARRYTTMETETIMIVDGNDNCIGSMEKMAVHRYGVLHRAFSILLFDGTGNMLIQRRSSTKYHSPLLWANACCSHQREGESLSESAARRLREELGITGISLSESFVFKYKCSLDNALIENEIDHVLVGRCLDRKIDFNYDEIAEVKWISINELLQSILKEEGYACWFRLIIEKMAKNKMALPIN